jgi:hypothetical protein
MPSTASGVDRLDHYTGRLTWGRKAAFGRFVARIYWGARIPTVAKNISVPADL